MHDLHRILVFGVNYWSWTEKGFPEDFIILNVGFTLIQNKTSTLPNSPQKGMESGSPTLPSSGAAHHGNPGCQGAMSLAVRTPRASKLLTPCDSTGVAKEPGGWAGRKLGRFGSIRTSLKSKKFFYFNEWAKSNKRRFHWNISDQLY